MLKSIFAAGLLLFSTHAAAAEWQAGGVGFIGADPVYSGNVLGYDLYVCTAYTSVGWQAGHIVKGQAACYVAWGTSTISYSKYYVLQGNADFLWVDRNIASQYRTVQLDPQGTVPTGVCRVSSNLHNGKLIGTPEDGLCYVSWGAGSSYTTVFDVLVLAPVIDL